MKMKVMLVDDHPLFMEGLQYLLKTHGIEVIGIAKDGREALEKARILKPDIILMDINMPKCNGLDALRMVKAEMSEIKIVMLTISEKDEDLFDAIKYGASGYLLKTTNASDLVDMLSGLEKGEVYLSPVLAAQVLREFKGNDHYSSHKPSENTKIEQLTDRHLEVLRMVAKGITYKDAGDSLGLTERTVKYHMGRIIDLLHLENRAQVIAFAVRMGLVKNNKND